MRRACRVGAVEVHGAPGRGRARASSLDQGGAAPTPPSPARPRSPATAHYSTLDRSPDAEPGPHFEHRGAGQVAHDDEVADTGARQSGNLLGGHAAGHEDRNGGACAGPSDVAQPRPGAAGLGRRGFHRARPRCTCTSSVRRALEVGRAVRRQPDDGVGAEDAPGQRRPGRRPGRRGRRRPPPRARGRAGR